MARKAAFCSQCARYVWLTPDGLCENGHSKPNLRDIRETDTLPTASVGAAAVSASMQQPIPVSPVQPVAAPQAAPWETPEGVPAPPAAPWETGAPVGLEAELAATGDPHLYAMLTEVQPAQTDVLGKRVIAYIIDILVLSFLQGIIGFGLGIFLAIITAGNISEGAASGSGYLMGVVITLAYFTAFEAGLGYTPGKALFGLRVMNKDRTKISVGQALGRNAARFVDLLFMGLIGLLAARNSAYRQRYGDQWANTYVVRS